MGAHYDFLSTKSNLGSVLTLYRKMRSTWSREKRPVPAVLRHGHTVFFPRTTKYFGSNLLLTEQLPTKYLKVKNPC